MSWLGEMRMQRLEDAVCRGEIGPFIALNSLNIIKFLLSFCLLLCFAFFTFNKQNVSSWTQKPDLPCKPKHVVRGFLGLWKGPFCFLFSFWRRPPVGTL